MEKHGSMRQSGASHRALTRAGTITNRQVDSKKSLVPQESRRRLNPSPSGLAVADANAAGSFPVNELDPTRGNSRSNNTSSFNALELLGPSLLEVLTLVNPPQPRAQRDAQQQQAGEGTVQEHEDSDNNHHVGNSSSSEELLPSTAEAAKFDTGISRSAILGKVADASVDNARKTQEYFAKILDKLKIEATGLVLLQESTVLLYVETTADQFLVLCRLLLRQKIIDAASMRVFASCDDNPGRILQGLYFKKVTLAARQGNSGGDSSEWADDAFRQNAIETFLNLIKFAKKIGLMAPAEIRKCLMNLAISDQMLLPANDLVLWLLTRDEFMSLDEFLHVYDSPIEIELESERVWPVHPLIHY
ncbi:hypothetical protein PybrP1_011431 [[Pythium] brassicae (nom. inval.)]|nr:hypothetical protein PybrP1_011431 [[Pythium] brassicae (nom. inval.)]